MPVPFEESPLTPANLAMNVSRGLWVPAKHLSMVNRLITEIAYSKTSRFLMVSMPPRHGKSFLISRYFPAWMLGMFPDKQVILTSYEADFAAAWGRQARDVLEEHGMAQFGVTVSGSSSSAARWDIHGRLGGMRAVGMGGPLTGKGGHLIVIDDPVKGWAESQSELYRRQQWDWYLGTLRTRLEPGGSIILLMTRWNEDDLAGRLELASAENPAADQWERLSLPAIAEPSLGEMEAEGFDEKTWRDAMGRGIGEALWPGRWPREVMLQTMATLGEEKWGAEYQQRPSNPKGDMFPVEKWQFCDVPPAGTKLLRAWDLAATAKKASGDPDWTASVLMGVNDDTGATYVVDARRVRSDPLETEQFVADTAREDAEMWRCKRIRIPQDPGQAGKSQANYWIRKVLAGFAVEATLDSGDKVTRVQPFAAQQRAGNVYLCRGAWNKPYIEEFRSFGPTGAKSAHDDWVDASSAAYGEITGLGSKHRVRLIL